MLKFKTSVIIKSSTSVGSAKIRVGYWKKYHLSEKILGHRRTNGMSWKLRGQMMDIMDNLMSVDWHRPCFRNVCMIQHLSTYSTGKTSNCLLIYLGLGFTVLKDGIWEKWWLSLGDFFTRWKPRVSLWAVKYSFQRIQRNVSWRREALPIC